METYEGAATHAIDDIQSGFFEMVYGKSEHIDEETAEGVVKGRVLFRLADLDAIRQEAALLLLNDARATGWYSTVEAGDQQYDNIETLIGDFQARFVENTTGSAMYDYKFVVNQMIPMLEKLGMRPEIASAILTTQPLDGKKGGIAAKLRDAVPEMRRLFKSQIDDDKFKEMMVAILEDIFNPEVSRRQFKVRRDERMHKLSPNPPVVNQDSAAIYQISSSRFILAIDADNQAILSAVQVALRPYFQDIQQRSVFDWVDFVRATLPIPTRQE